MKVVILAGGFGTRLSELTEEIPKPMVRIDQKPILWHIMQRYAFYGYNDFVIALGYKSEVIKEYFYKMSVLGGDFTLDLMTGGVTQHKSKPEDWKVTLIDTGIGTMTGGRLKRLSEYVGEEFHLTYGDGVSDIDIDTLVKHHRECGKSATVTAVRPPARFGELKLDGHHVREFAEKPQLDRGWISGGYFVMKKEVIDLIKDDETMLEREPLESLACRGDLAAFRHEGFWQCMDTKRDLEYLRSLHRRKAPWLCP